MHKGVEKKRRAYAKKRDINENVRKYQKRSAHQVTLKSIVEGKRNVLETREGERAKSPQG